MQQALDMLNGIADHVYFDQTLAEVITALEQALETEQAMKDVIVGGTGVMLDGKRIDPATIYKEEPVAWRATSPDGKLSNKFVGTSKEVNWTPIYTEPPKQWVGLTEIEICDIEADELTSASSETFSFARAIEAKLKEKNGG
jgi:hypothetical protein